jgi:AcrR family transcriptional regulator
MQGRTFDPALAIGETRAMSASGTDSRREAVLETAAAVFARRGVRTSVKDIADAAGILPGSLYHHVESKDALVVELIERYHAAIAAVAADGARATDAMAARSVDEVILEVAEALARCTRRHRGALLLTLYELPDTIGARFRRPITEQLAPVEQVMHELVRRGQDEGTFRAEVDARRLAKRLCRSMVSAGIRMYGDDGEIPASSVSWAYLRDGVAVAPPSDRALDRSPAMRAACGVIGEWRKSGSDEDERMAAVRAVARAEFGRRGYQATTIRDIAAAAGLSTATVHRLIGSKDDLLRAVMQSFSTNAGAGWRAVLDADATPVEKLDALMWVHINLFDRFGDEFLIGLAWTLEYPGDELHLEWSFQHRLDDLRALLVEGIDAGEMRAPAAPTELQARCLLEATWMPEEFVRAGIRETHLFGRDTLLRGAARRARA